MNRWTVSPWKEINCGRGAVAKAVCFLAGHDVEEHFTYGGWGTRVCLRCRKRWECFLAPYSRGVSY